MHPALRFTRDEIRATSVRLLAYVSGLVALAIMAASLVEKSPVRLRGERTPRPAWIEVERPYPAFALAMNDLPESEFRYAIRRHAAGNGRKDILTWDDSAAVPRVMVEVYRPGTEQDGFAGAAEEIAARLPAGAAVRPAGRPETKFGPTPFVTIAWTDSATTRRCLGFARPFDDPRMQIAGWWCKGDGEAVERALVACALDRLMLLSAASDPKVGRLFAHAELRRDFCGKKPVPLATTIRHRNWPSDMAAKVVARKVRRGPPSPPPPLRLTRYR